LHCDRRPPGWDYVANKSVGFMDCWLSWNKVCEACLYFQIVEQEFHVKLEVEEYRKRTPLRITWSDKFLAKPAISGFAMPKSGRAVYVHCGGEEIYDSQQGSCRPWHNR
ncbi:MAG: hypothetical protein P1V97_02690, partial [Planctomycetota bacterium]|nr:hypothetical protein [Planctomycetota bacterium]